MKPVIEIHQLGKKYRIRQYEPYLSFRDVITHSIRNVFKKKENKKDFWALRDINLKIEKGERIGIIGRNGAGKSTLLKILSRVTWPTAGEAIIRGRLASLLEVGTGFHPELTGRENIYLNGSILGLRKMEIKKQFEAIVNFSELEMFLDVPLKNYSTGMHLRLAFAVAAHLEPEVLLIDEVLAVGDMEFQKKCVGKIQEVSKEQGRTILFVSHQLNFVKKLCTRCIWLEKGEIKKTGGVTEVIEKYVSSINNEQYTVHYIRNYDSSNYYFSNIQIVRPQINIGDDIEICIGFNEKYRNKRLALGFDIVDETGEMISQIINEDDNFSTINATSKIWVNLKRLNLRPGKYSLSCWAGYDMFHEIEWVDKAVTFEILESNTFTHRIAAFPASSKIIIQSQWRAE